MSELVNICVLLPSDFLDFTNFNKIWLSKACKKLDTHFSFIEIPVSDKKVIFFCLCDIEDYVWDDLRGKCRHLEFSKVHVF